VIDRDRLERDARYILDVYDHPALHRVARTLLAALEDPVLMLPEGMFVGRRPELYDKGVPAR
jgi:hypothetical protein